MANPNFPSDGQSERIDALVGTTGTVYLKLGIGSKAVTGATDPAAWHGVATHIDGATAATTDGVVVIGGTVGTGAAAVKHLLVDSSGRPIMVGAAAAGAAVAGNPILVGGSDGTNAQNLSVDTSGRARVVGATGTGNAASGINPVLSAGSDGTSVRSLITDALGDLVLAGHYLSTFKSVQTAATGDTAVWTPASGKKFRLKRLFVMVTQDAATSGGGVITIKLRDSTTDMNLTFDLWVPSATIAAPIGVAFSSGSVDLGFGVLSATINNVLNVNLSAALSAGKCRVTVSGTEE